MCHAIDPAVVAAEQFRLDALAAHRRALAARHGTPTCGDCGEPISAMRQALGAVRCLDCERDAELRARRFATAR